MLPYDESTSVVWTDEMCQAWGVAAPLLEDGDKVGARMAFKESYARLIEEARQHRAEIKALPERRMGDGRMDMWLDALLEKVDAQPTAGVIELVQRLFDELVKGGTIFAGDFADRERQIALLQDQVNRLVAEKYEAKAEIERLHAPPEADAMERAVDFLWPHYTDPIVPKMEYAKKSSECQRLTRALTEYGDQRAREARTMAIEKAAQVIEERSKAPSHTTWGELKTAIRALATVEPEPELGQPDEPVSEEAALVPGASQQWFDDERAGRIRRGGEIVG